MTDLLQQHISDREAERRARAWLRELDHEGAVGARHHIVPRFLLQRFASANGQLLVRTKKDGRATVRSINDLAVRDFYTAVSENASLDSSLESLLSVVEGSAAEVLRQHLDFRPFARPRPFTAEERAILDCFVSMQAVRGMRIRRTIEVISDYTVKLLNQDRISEDDIQNSDFVPHPNEHLKMFGRLAERSEDVLRARTAGLIRLDKPLLIIGDEPVLSVHDEDTLDRTFGAPPGGLTDDMVLLGSRTGYANARMIIVPICPSVALIYGPPWQHHVLPEVQLTGDDAASFADELNEYSVASAIEWVAASPDHPDFASMRMPPAVPLLTIHDYGSSAAARVNATAATRPIRRVRAEDVHDISPRPFGEGLP